MEAPVLPNPKTGKEGSMHIPERDPEKIQRKQRKRDVSETQLRDKTVEMEGALRASWLKPPQPLLLLNCLTPAV